MKPTPVALALWRVAVATIVGAMSAAVIAFALTAPAPGDVDHTVVVSPQGISEAMR